MPDQYDQILNYLLKIREGTGDPWPQVPKGGLPQPLNQIAPWQYAVSSYGGEPRARGMNERTPWESASGLINTIVPNIPEAPMPAAPEIGIPGDLLQKDPGWSYDIQGLDDIVETSRAASVADEHVDSAPKEEPKPPIEKPKGRPIDEKSHRDQQLLKKYVESQERKREDLQKKKGQLSGLRNIAEGLGRIYPSVKADYLLTGGPPQKEPVIAEDLRVQLGEIEDKLSGQRIAGALGMPELEGLTGDDLKVVLATLGKWNKESEAEGKEARRMKMHIFDKWHSNLTANDLRSQLMAANNIRGLLKPGASAAEMKSAIRQMMPLSGDKRISNVDIKDMGSPWGVIPRLHNWLTKALDDTMSEDYRKQLIQAADVMSEAARRALRLEAGSWAHGMAESIKSTPEDVFGMIEPGMELPTMEEVTRYKTGEGATARTIGIKNPVTREVRDLTPEEYEAEKRDAAKAGINLEDWRVE